MTNRGKLIVLEGIDGSGKRTQLQMLLRALVQRGIPCMEMSFPQYEGFFGQIVARYLNGDFGQLSAVDPHFSALLYANDRLEARPAMETALREGKFILADRYVPSNLAHQCARVAPEKRNEFAAWLRRLEYEIYGLPQEDLVLYLRLPAAEAQRRVDAKDARNYTVKQRDLHEADAAHLRAAAGMYDELARERNWITIDCGESQGRTAPDAQTIHEAVVAAVDAQFFAVPAPTGQWV